jgi:hypothetical protein
LETGRYIRQVSYRPRAGLLDKTKRFGCLTTKLIG